MAETLGPPNIGADHPEKKIAAGIRGRLAAAKEILRRRINPPLPQGLQTLITDIYDRNIELLHDVGDDATIEINQHRKSKARGPYLDVDITRDGITTAYTSQRDPETGLYNLRHTTTFDAKKKNEE